MSSTSPVPQQNGVLVLLKPKGPTSARCVSLVKRLGQRKIGHAGTLDPMASGVLLILLGQATKISGLLMEGGRKVYAAAALLGRETDTWDADGAVVAERPWDRTSPDAVREAVASWRGELEQLVPPYSAAKSAGTPLYRLAREGREVPVRTKTVVVHSSEVLSLDLPVVRFRVCCGSGTYVRSLAHSLGTRLGCGATLTELTREYSHPFGISQATPLDEVLACPERLPELVRPIEEALAGWPVVRLDAAGSANVRNGVPVPCPGGLLEPVRRNGGRALLGDGSGILALAELRGEGERAGLAVARGLWSNPSDS